ncbi:hypothetical protein [Prosthecobacter sp.]|uniref:hypothetical protein n=1 Tax=Prosthecobacter sp. TaxID=1965333 RepID=UPI00378378CB
MKRLLLPACLVVLAACSQPDETDPLETLRPKLNAGVARALSVLEHNCVHCHGDNRLSSMPPINDTQAISKLIGSRWIVPGRPELSRFFQVVTFADEVPGAMPPSGHAISSKDMKILRDWIKKGAPLPAQNVRLTPQGPLPRSV